MPLLCNAVGEEDCVIKMDDPVAHGAKDGLVTDECVASTEVTEVWHLQRSSRVKCKRNEAVPEPFKVSEGESPAIEVHNERPEKSDFHSGQSWSRVTESCNPDEIEPGHCDLLNDEVSQENSRQFWSEPSSSKGSSACGDSCHSSKGFSSHSSGASGLVGKSKLAQYLSDWVEDTASVGGTRDHYDLPATEYPSCPRSEPAKNLNERQLIRVEAQPIRGRSQPIGGGAQLRREAQPLLAHYTWEEIVAMTGAREHELGTGGTCTVYKGIMPGNKQVAVKILEEASRQGDFEFVNEVDLLSRINHVNLVKLLGYCQEDRKRVLLYEYAEEGTIWDHFQGNGIFLDWRTRLRIALESACGLEYLHTGCTPRIIHRDIKSSNILLTKHLTAKVADFGLSKLGEEHDDGTQTHMTTAVKGTPGYLDPEYLRTCQLNEKSDIFSFGVVLLEIITGRKPIDQTANKSFLGDWVKARCKSSGMKGAVDPKLGDAYNPKSVKVVVTLALKCIEPSAKNRPDIRLVVEQLRAATVLELNTPKASKWSLKSLLR